MSKRKHENKLKKLTEEVELGIFVPHPLNSLMRLVLWLNLPETVIWGWLYETWADLGLINDPMVIGMNHHPHLITAPLKASPRTPSLKLLVARW